MGNFRVTEDCHGQLSHHHGNQFIIIIIIIIKLLGSVTGRERVNSSLKGLSGAKPLVFHVFSGKVASVFAEGGSLFPRLRASIGKVVDKKCAGL